MIIWVIKDGYFRSESANQDRIVIKLYTVFPNSPGIISINNRIADDIQLCIKNNEKITDVRRDLARSELTKKKSLHKWLNPRTYSKKGN